MRKIEIGKSCSPSKIVSKEQIKCQRVLVSYGGGMGGANKSYYATKIQKEQALQGRWILKLLDGRTIDVNPSFIVENEEINVVKIVSDITEHLNFNKSKEKCVGKTLETEYICLNVNEEAVFVDKHTPRHTYPLENRVVCKFSTDF
jgi:hypothetical protein